MITRGEIYLDVNFKYPLGNVEDKYLLILNKTFQNSDPVFVVTATTKFDKERNKLGCNHRVHSFWLKAKEDYFPEDTFLQLFILEHPLAAKEFQDKITAGTITLKTKLKEETVNKIMKCVEQIKDDLTSMNHKYLF